MYFTGNIVSKIPIYAAKRSFKPILVFVTSLACLTLFLLHYRTSQLSISTLESNPFPREFTNSKYQSNSLETMKPTSNGQINDDNTDVEAQNPIKVEGTLVAEKRHNLEKLGNEGNQEKTTGKIETLKHERIINGKHTRVKELEVVNNFEAFQKNPFYPSSLIFSEEKLSKIL